MQTNRISQFVLTLVVLAGLFLVAKYFTMGNVVKLPQSEFEARITAGDVAEVQLVQSATEARGKFRPESEVAQQNKTVNFTSNYNADYSKELIDLMRLNNVKYEMVNPSLWDSLFSPSTLLLFAMFAVPIIFLIWLMNRQMQNSGNNQAMNFGKSRARLAGDGKRRITFADVAGVDEAVQELTEVVDFLRDPEEI